MPKGTQLLADLQERIRAAGAISFCEFMALALYAPQWGYYNRPQIQIGRRGDFITSSSLTRDFAELLTEAFVQMWHALDRPQKFTLLEMGAGEGQFAAGVLGYSQATYPDFFTALEYQIQEQSPTLRERQRQRLAPWGDRLHWLDSSTAAEPIVGCIFSNELVDAFPVHRLQWQGSNWQEIYVSLNAQGEFQEVLRPLSGDRIHKYFATVGINPQQQGYSDGYRTEVNLNLIPWLKDLSQHLERGFVLTIDYGYPAQQYYHPARCEGTLQCYYQHRYHDNPYCFVGQQDITAHVDVTALTRYGEHFGLETLYVTRQSLFLMALGLGDRLLAQQQRNGNLLQALNRHQSLHQLIDPLGLGGFYVVLQGKQATLDLPLLGELDTALS
ncbi:class I SAM-dependent methyltransferase [Thermosynechococcus sp. PKX82]|uniref:class I SAM-dependent methyltransferase n=1 Tax=Thermosynechococcus sp. PKX82 TaxID=3074086 RepID=UPI0028738CCF|nr:class I SAM-dependent methyltransferase [Thermosynechococcus sp. PKX82]WNC28949.1 class I SAM-dependent methyltransferase [Thermosynechococcus sp. PKX82]